MNIEPTDDWTRFDVGRTSVFVYQHYSEVKLLVAVAEYAGGQYRHRVTHFDSNGERAELYDEVHPNGFRRAKRTAEEFMAGEL